MAERIVSPGVFTNEIDQSFLPSAVSEIGAALIGISSKGPAFVPTVVESYSDFKVKFGGLNKDYFLPYAAKSYLKNAGKCTVVRVLGTGGHTVTNPVILKGGSGAAAVYASSSIDFIGAYGSTVATPMEGDYIVITGSSGFGYRFIVDDGPTPPANTSTDFYFTSSVGAGTYYAQADLNGFVLSASNAINAANIGMTAVQSGSQGALGISASAAGTGGNGSITIDTGSIYGGKAGLSSSAIPPAAAGGTDAVDAEVYAAVWPRVNDGAEMTALGASHIDDCGGGTAQVGSFCFAFNASAANTTNTMSLHSGDSNYISNVLGTDNGGNYNGFVKFIFKSTADAASATADLDCSNQDNKFGAYMNAKTPYIVSQTGSAADDVTNLFKFETLSSGYGSNKFIKVAFANIKPTTNTDVTEYGQFDVIVRNFGDSDKKPEVVESFPGCNIDPTSPNYIVRRIGDMKETFNASTGKIDIEGDYPVKSKYIRVDNSSLSTQFKDGNASPTLLPFGFKGYNFPMETEAGDFGVDLPLKPNMSESGEFQSKFFHGLAFDESNKYDLYPYFSEVPTTSQGGTTFQTNTAATGSYSGSQGVFTLNGIHGIPVDGSLNTKKFILGFQGGENGFDPYETSEKANGLGNALIGNSDGNANWNDFKNALMSVANPDEIDINMLAVPGLNMIEHTLLYGKAKSIVEERADCFLVFDAGNSSATKTQVISQVQAEDNNYVATYYPWVKIFDDENNQYTWVPPSTVLPGVVAFTDKVAHPWFAPAGLTRGGLSEVVMAKDRLTQAERDDLYEARINPIATFPGQGICVWGQKTLQAKPSALDRVNVRRLLITLKKFIASTSKFLVFEQNNAALRQRFLNIVQPYLEGVQQKAGLTSFKVVVDDTVNTPDVIDRNELRGNIYLKPTRTAEFIVLDFIVMGSGAVFPE